MGLTWVSHFASLQSMGGISHLQSACNSHKINRMKSIGSRWEENSLCREKGFNLTETPAKAIGYDPAQKTQNDKVTEPDIQMLICSIQNCATGIENESLHFLHF